MFANARLNDINLGTTKPNVSRQTKFYCKMNVFISASCAIFFILDMTKSRATSFNLAVDDYLKKKQFSDKRRFRGEYIMSFRSEGTECTHME
jgi:hypothetical protein